jgi:SAM-dependent MidA family methyltransferase
MYGAGAVCLRLFVLRRDDSISNRVGAKTHQASQARWPITFHDFMQTALYDPELGYYNTERSKIGAQGDYYTSSNVHPASGRARPSLF